MERKIERLSASQVRKKIVDDIINTTEARIASFDWVAFVIGEERFQQQKVVSETETGFKESQAACFRRSPGSARKRELELVQKQVALSEQ